MNMPKKCITASIFAVFLFNCIPTYAASGFTAKQFLALEKAAQDSYFQTSITMAGVIATQTHKKMALCIDGWYFENTETIQKRNKKMLELMGKYLADHPAGIIAASIERACGAFSNRD